jgi:hypothetical protein
MLILISLGLVLYLIFSSQPVTIMPDSDIDQRQITEKVSQEASQVDLDELEKSYQQTAGLIFADFRQIADETWLDVNTPLSEEGQPATSTKDMMTTSEILKLVSDLKNRLMAIKVPPKFKDLHLNLVLAMNKFSNFIETNDEEEKEESQILINQAKVDYD